MLQFLRWASPALLGLIVPELWEDGFVWLRASGYQPIAQFVCVIWILFVVGHELPISPDAKRSRAYRMISTLVVAILCGASWWFFVARQKEPTTTKVEPVASDVPLKRIEETVDRVEKLLKERNPAYGNPGDRGKVLLGKYPAGYILYLADQSTQVLRYESRANDFEIERMALRASGDSFYLTVPRIRSKRSGNMIAESLFGFPRIEGRPSVITRIDGVTVWVEVLALRPEETAFVIGFIQSSK